jgi:hypothetical protein
VSEPKPKSFEISKRAVWEAWLRVKANKGAAGVDEQSITEFERNLKGNLYKLWNRLSSGCRLSRTGSPRPLCAGTWSLGWSRSFTRTPTGIGRGGRRWTRSGSAGSAAGDWTGS